MGEKTRSRLPFGGLRIPHDLRARFEAQRLETNVGRMLGFSIYIIAFQLLLQVVNILVPQWVGTGMPVPIDVYILLSLLTLLLGIVFCVLFVLARRGRITNPRLKALFVQLLLYLYAVLQLAFCTANILSNQGLMSYVIFILMFSMVPVLSWRQSLPTILAAAAYVAVVLVASNGLSGSDLALTGIGGQWTVTSLHEFLYTDLRANLIIVTGLAIFASIVVYNLYVAHFLKAEELARHGEELARHGEELEQMVQERTAELWEKTIAAEEASRAKSRFLATISHEIRTPLNAIVGMTHVARKSSDATRIAHALDQVESSTTLLLDLLNDVLDMSGIETGQLKVEYKRFPLKKALQDIVRSGGVRCSRKAIRLETNVDDLAEYTVMGDRLRLAQVLGNLLDNACKFSSEDAVVRLTVECEGTTPAAPTTLAAAQPPAAPTTTPAAPTTPSQPVDGRLNVSFVVSDCGIGMDEETQSRLFKPFEQGESQGMRHTGLGLGLTISQSLVEMMGGHIEVKSELGRGSTFSFTLGFDLVEPEGESAVLVPDLTGQHILSVEDIAINRDILRELLEETNAIVEDAPDGLEAVQRFERSPEGYYNLIFMDLLMPRMDGYEAAYTIRALSRADARQVPIVALSANAYPEDVEKSLAAGMNAHIAKPLDFKSLMQTLNTYLAH